MDPNSKHIPDGGWGWVIVGAVSLINMSNQSILSVFGLLFGGELKRMEQETFTAALITNLNSLALNFSGLFIGPAIKSFKPRNVAACGCILVSFGMSLCAFANQGWHFIIGYSFFVGLGLGLISPSTFMAINSYFSTKRGRAVGVSLAGTGLGHVMLPHIVRFILDNYGFKVAVLTMSLLSLSGLIGAFLLKPYTPIVKYNNCQNIRPLLETKTNEQNNKSPLIDVKVINTQKTNDIYRETVIVTETKTNTFCDKICQRLIQAMDLELLKDPVFWSIILGLALTYTSTINFTMLFPNFLQNTVGMSSTGTATCMSVVAGADILCRLLLPCLTDKLKIPYRVVFLLGTLGLLVSRTAIAGSTDMANIILMSIFIGISKSATVLNNNLTISDYCRPDKLPGGLGLNMISKGLIVITIGPLLGWIHDYTDSYIICLHAQNILLLLVVAVWAPEIYYRYWKQQKEDKHSLGSFNEVTEIKPVEVPKLAVC